MKKLTQKILFALTAILLFVSMSQKQFNFPKFRALKGVVVDEPMPKLTFQSYCDGEFQQKTEQHLKQHFGFRPPLIRLYNQYLWDFFKKTPVSKGILSFGKDGWLYEPWVVADYYQNQFRNYASDTAEMTAMFTPLCGHGKAFDSDSTSRADSSWVSEEVSPFDVMPKASRKVLPA